MNTIPVRENSLFMIDKLDSLEPSGMTDTFSLTPFLWIRCLSATVRLGLRRKLPRQVCTKMMNSFIKDREVDSLCTENVRLLSENGELRKMVSLMQENVELRYALHDHGNQACIMSPVQTTPSRELRVPLAGCPGAVLAAAKERCSTMSSPSKKERHASTGSIIPSSTTTNRHYSLAAKEPCKISENQPQQGHPNSLYMNMRQPDVIQGNKKLIERLSKLHVPNNSPKDQKGLHFQRRIAEYT